MLNFPTQIRFFYHHYQKWIKIIVSLFAASMALGAIAAFRYPELMAQISGMFNERFGTDPALDIRLASQIFLQNLTASLVAWLGGFLLGFVPAVLVFVNGFLLGYVMLYVLNNSEAVGQASLFLAAGLVPHAIFELPAFLLAAVLGMKLGLGWLSLNAKGARGIILKQTFLNTARYFLVVVLALAIAAVIEVFISGQLVDNF